MRYSWAALSAVLHKVAPRRFAPPAIAVNEPEERKCPNCGSARVRYDMACDWLECSGCNAAWTESKSGFRRFYRSGNPTLMVSARTLTLALVGLLLCSPAFAQSQPVYQSGSMSPHHLPKFLANGKLGDVGGLTGDVNGRGVAPFSIQDSLGVGVCTNSGPTSAGFEAFCLGHDASGNALLTVDSYGGAASGSLRARINGVEVDLITGAVTGFAAIASSGSASDLTTGTVPSARLVAIPNASLANPSVTVNTHPLALGGALTLAFSDFAGTVAAAQLPNPSATTKGGVQSKVAVSNQWINSISTSGVPSSTQPACTNLSDATTGCSGNAAGLTSGTLPQARLGASQTACTPTDASGATLTFTSVSCHYDQIGNIVFIYFQLTYPVTANGSAAKIGGLPLTVANANYAAVGQACIANAGANTPVLAQFVINTTTVLLLKPTSAGILNSDLSTDTVRCAIWYPAA